jgi:hypothetical protein
MIQYLCTEGIKERHWNEIFEILGLEDQFRNETMQGIEGKDFKDYFRVNDIKNNQRSTDTQAINSKLEEISDTASKEFKNERLLRTMKNDWEPAEFGCKIYKDTFILDGEAIDLV